MLNCHTCMRKCLQTLIGDSSILASSSKISSPLIRAQNPWASQRAFSVRANTQNRLRDPSEHPVSSVSKSKSPGRTDRRQEWLDSRGIRPVDKPVEVKDYEIRRNLKFLKDPLKLAEHVRKCLRDDDFDSTLATVRAASKDVLCTVSWNHLIDWQLSKGKMNAAIKTYNEMKKRAQVPDAYTYTIIFRGCAEHPDSAQALTKVMSIYQGMLSEKSPIKPNVIHLNSLLKMCARANDMDALFAVVNNLPDFGIGTPDKTSYTIIINAIRMHLLTDSPRDISSNQQQAERRKAILNARNIWADITARWRKGDVMIDEELVCSMGRILLMGDRSDADDVLSLVEQTMNMPRQTPRLGTPERALIDPTSQGRREKDHPLGSTVVENASEESYHLKSVEQTEQAMATTSSMPAKATVLGLSSYAQPGRNTLSLITKALLELNLKKTAVQYWHIFTDGLGVIPDGDNFHSYLRVLRMGRASTEATELVMQMPKELLKDKTFRIAMATCDRDKNNRHAFNNAGKLLDIMQMHLHAPDVMALRMYLNVAITSPAYSPAGSNGESQPSKLAQGRQILRATERLNPSIVNLRSLLAFGSPTDRPLDEWRNSPRYINQVLDLVQNMIRATDVLMNQALVPRDMYGELTRRRSKLSAFVTKQKLKNSRLTLGGPTTKTGHKAEEEDNESVTSSGTSQRSELPAKSHNFGQQNEYKLSKGELILDRFNPQPKISSRW